MTTYLNIPCDFDHKERLAQLSHTISNAGDLSYYFLTSFIDLNIDPILMKS
ncbi:hypothetical protein ACFSYG_03755 [Leeuwenhoekiella polynyae]|uniref:Uncharacterized protein n=1 Tax=Leeuwenhoekiella polynyae TaxID=1550906 RepID=A0A4Q0P0C8_9FLAO|nr:hypothetical protein [Leeuwenhoekiella polynyae]RXG19923.1 hypothetical protein DSM02_2944 [Leeuwenhoekiella polynyae]